ncbi:MAG: translocation/assembly module TamB domain-containing protein [Brevinematia bacterium]
MKWLRNILFIFFTFVVFLYFLIFIGSIIFVSNYKKEIENQIAKALLFEDAEIKGFIHIPFVLIRFKEINLFNVDGTYIKFKNMDLYYDIFKFSKENPVEICNKINIENASLYFPYNIAKDYIFELLKKYSNVYLTPRQKHKVNIKEAFLNLDFFSGINTATSLKNAEIFISYNLLQLNGLFNMKIDQLNKINLLDTELNYELNFGIKDGKNFISFSSKFDVSNFIIGGLPLLENENFGFSTTNFMNIKENIAKNLFELKFTNDNVTIFNLKKDFLISYSKKPRTYLLEYLMPEGKYFTELNGNFNDRDFLLDLSISNYNTLDKLNLSFFSKNNKKAGKIKLSSRIFKNLNADINLNKTINGELYFNFDLYNQPLIGILKFEYKDKLLRLKSNKLLLGDINFGGFDTYITFSSNILSMESTETLWGIAAKGKIDGNKAKLTLKFNNSLISSINSFMNASFNIMAKTKPLTIDELKGDINIRNFKTSARILSGDFQYSNKILNLKQLSLFNLINLSLTDRIERVFRGYLNNINGEIVIKKSTRLPLTGNMLLNQDLSVNNFFFTIDKEIFATLTNITNSNYFFKITAKNYDTERFGLDGKFNLDFTSTIKAGKLNQLTINSGYLYNNHPLKFYLKSIKNELDNNIYDIPLFSLETEDDKLFGKGYATTGKNKRLFVYFIRGGKIDINLKDDLLSGEININKFILRNPFDKKEESTPLFFNLNATFKQKNDFDILNNLDAYGNLSIYDIKNQDSFSLQIPAFSFQKGELRLSYSKFKYSGADTSFSIYGKNNIYNLNGNFIFDKLSFNYYAKIFKNGENWTANYKIVNFNIANISQNFYGKVVKDKQYLILYSEGSSGITGYVGLKKNIDWKIDFIGNNMEIYSAGSFISNEISMDLDYNIPLSLLEGKFYIKKAKGNFKGKLKLENSEINGYISFVDCNAGVDYSKTYLSNFNAIMPVSNSSVLLENLIIPTTTGNFSVSGFINIKEISTPYITIKLLPVSKNSHLSLNYNKSGTSLQGKILPTEIELTGSKDSLGLRGDITIENFSANLPLNSFSLSEIKWNELNLFESLKLDVNINIGNNNKLSTPLNQFIFRKNSRVKIYGRPSLEEMKIRGDIIIDRGDFTYFSKTFSIKEGNISFQGDDIIPYVKMLLWYRYKDVNKENVDIYLTFEGKASKIILKEFYSIPEKPKDELSMILGISKGDEESLSSRTPSVEYIKSGVGFAENVFFFTPLSLEVKRRLGLDLFSFRSTILQNYVEAGLERQTNVDFRNYLSGSGIVMGKYILPNLFFEYELFLEKDSVTSYGLIPVHTVGLELDLSYFNLGWKYQPYNVGKETTYEQMFEFKFIRKF